MAKDILKEAIADAKAVREVALANAKAALEEAFTPKLQSMLSAKLSEELNEEDMEETVYNEEDMEETYGNMEEEDMEETYGNMEEEDMEETYGNMEEEDMEETSHRMEENLDEEINLEEILNELELEEAKDEDKVDEAKKDDDDVNEGSQDSGPFRGTVAGKPKKIKTKVDTFAGDAAKEGKEDDVKKEAKDDMEEEKLDEMGRPIYKAEDANYAGYTADRVHEGEEFDLDALLEEINNLDEEKEDTNEGDFGEAMGMMDENILSKVFKGIQDFAAFVNTGSYPADKTLSNALFNLLPSGSNPASSYEDWQKKAKEAGANSAIVNSKNWKDLFMRQASKGMAEEEMEESVNPLAAELEETKAALETVRTELNEVNLLNSKLLYVNRIFKANTLDESQKLRVVETLDKAETAKEAKLIYETIKDTFTVANAKKASFKNKTKSLKEGIGMASKAAGTSTAPKKEVISESDNMVNRFQKLANIKISQ